MPKNIDDIIASKFNKPSAKPEEKISQEDNKLFETSLSQSLLSKKTFTKPKKVQSDKSTGREKLKRDYINTMIDFNNSTKNNMDDAFLSLLKAKELIHQDLIQLKKVYDYLSKKDGWADLRSYYKYLMDKYQNQNITETQKKFFLNIHDYLKYKKDTLSLDVKVINNINTKALTIGDAGIQDKINKLTEDLREFHKKHIFDDIEFFGSCEIKADELIAKYEKQNKKQIESIPIKENNSTPKNHILKLYSNNRNKI